MAQQFAAQMPPPGVQWHGQFQQPILGSPLGQQGIHSQPGHTRIQQEQFMERVEAAVASVKAEAAQEVAHMRATYEREYDESLRRSDAERERYATLLRSEADTYVSNAAQESQARLAEAQRALTTRMGVREEAAQHAEESAAERAVHYE